MTDTVLAGTSPWSGALKRGRFGNMAGDAGVSVSESAAAVVGLLGQRKGAGASLLREARALGLDLPTTPRWVKAKGLTALWAGPGQWLVRRAGVFADLEVELSTLAPHATLIDQSHSRAGLRMGGPRVREALAKGLEIDLHPRAFASGDVAMTSAVGISTLLWQLDDRPTFEVAVPRSMAGSFWHWLAEASAEYGCTVEERS